MRCSITVQVEDNGQVTLDTVGVPITERVVIYGLLEQAKDLVRTYEPKKVVPVVAIPGELNGNPGGLRKL